MSTCLAFRKAEAVESRSKDQPGLFHGQHTVACRSESVTSPFMRTSRCVCSLLLTSVRVPLRPLVAVPRRPASRDCLARNTSMAAEAPLRLDRTAFAHVLELMALRLPKQDCHRLMKAFSGSVSRVQNSIPRNFLPAWRVWQAHRCFVLQIYSGTASCSLHRSGCWQ